MPQVVTPHPHGTVRALPTPKRVRARVGGTFVADSTDPKILVYGAAPHPRTYAFPQHDVAERLLTFGKRREDEHFGTVRDGDLRVDGQTLKGVARLHEGAGDLAGHISLRWDAMDAWYEEDEEVFIHPHDPFHRIDVLRSTRHVVVEVDGVSVAESRNPVLLFETGLPVRYYLPQTDVRLDLLSESDKTTGCPYKGFARYRHLTVEGKRHDDLVWTYATPLEGALKVAGLLCFFDERVDLSVDGDLQERPRTPWSES